MDRSLIEQYAQGAGKLAQAIQGLTPADFLATPVPGTWSIQQIVIHLMDCDLIASDRMKRVIAEDNPILIGFNENAFSQKLFYEKLDPFTAADVFKKNRELTAIILSNLPDAAFTRFGTHNERGKVSLADFVATYVQHLEHHLGFIRHKRQLLNKPL
ncbi:MAG TPA: DinB family protein [Phycisphaerae bacterium]|nr:DinB family protein [Phycisphaerae bacterium]